LIRLDQYWYGKHLLTFLLLPLSWIFCGLVLLRRKLYMAGILHSTGFPVPVIVVGNITVGGSGKTPLVSALVHWLQAQGFKPGIVSRGYGGRARHWPQQVRPDSDPQMVGDEPVMLSRNCKVPMAVAPDRVSAVQALLSHSECDVIISDDGMQHYRLARDLEIAVVDGIRRFGNGFCLPAGPLREPQGRLRTVDFVVSNGLAMRMEFPMEVTATHVVNLVTGEQQPLEYFRGHHGVHAVAGIGFPGRFFAYLRKQGLQIVEHPFPDHYAYKDTDLEYGDDCTVIMTEKDAVKCARYALANAWYMPVTAHLDDRFILSFRAKLDKIIKQKQQLQS
jgi:tetraacyldisaccharide 4'-kinase